jgi:DNA-damage-inducible protein D
MAGNEKSKVAFFEGKHIRKILQEGEWWFSIVDIVQVLTNSSIPKRYWSDLKRKLSKEGYVELYEKIVQLKFVASDGKSYATDCANTETMFRIIQSIPQEQV